MPWVVDVGSIAGGLSSMTIVSDTRRGVDLLEQRDRLVDADLDAAALVTSPKRR
jgi:hypothetical protein